MSKRTISIAGGTLIWDDGQVGIMLRAAQGEVGQDVQRRVYAVQKRMKRLAPVFRGTLRDGVHAESVSVSPTGPVGRVISTAPHTLVNELGRGPVQASGLTGRGELPQRMALNTRNGKPSPLAQSRLRWGVDNPGSRPTTLVFQLTPGGGSIFAARVGPADGSHFMERSIDVALD